MVQYPDKYTRAIKIRNPLDRLNGFIYIVYLTAIRTKSLTINIVNTDGWSSHSHGGDSTLHKLSIFHHRVYSQNSVRVHLIYTSPAQKLNSHKAQICIYLFIKIVCHTLFL